MNPHILHPFLYEKAKKKYQHMKHSAYKSGLVVQEYKRLGGKYRGKRSKKIGLSRWFAEKWRNQKGEVGYSRKGEIYRPTRRITSKTPLTLVRSGITGLLVYPSLYHIPPGPTLGSLTVLLKSSGSGRPSKN